METKPSNHSTNNPHDIKNPSRWGRFVAWLGRDKTFTDWSIVFFTGVLAGASIYQFIILSGQLDDMRKDQRPWIEISFKNGPLQTNTPLGFTINMVNKGKTPARAMTADMAIDAVKNGEEPTLNYSLPHSRFTTGLLFPNDPIDFDVVKKRTSADMKSVENEVLTQSELDDFATGKIFFVMYATVSYKDFFCINHWTRRCAAWVQTNVPGTFTGKKCTNYGDVDGN